MFDCPVCPKTNIEDSKCPQCKTDLTPLLRLRELPETYYTEGVTLAEQGQLDEAIERLSTAISLNSHTVIPYLALGNVYVQKKLFDEAIFHYQRALDIDPGNEDVIKAIEDVEKARVKLKEIREKELNKNSFLRRLLIGIPVLAFLLGLAIIPLCQNYLTQASKVDYTTLVTQINEKINNKSGLAGLGVSVKYIDNELYVSGSVPTNTHKDLVEEIAKNVKNDININTQNLTVTPVQVISPAFSYTVKPYDTLSLIAYRFYDDSRMWEKIYNVNRNLISNKNNIYVGQVLKIPIN